MHLHWPGNHQSRQVRLISIAAWNGLIISVAEISSNFLLYSRDFRHLKAVFSPFNPFLLTTVVLKNLFLCVPFLILHSFSSNLQDNFLSKIKPRLQNSTAPN